jgi:hypothetical protein
MKKIFGLVALGLLACGSSVASATLLVDGGMNLVSVQNQLGSTPNPPWVVAASRNDVPGFDDGAASESFADHDGGGFGLFFKAFVGNPPWDPTAGTVDASIYQDVAGTPNTLYQLTGWWGAEANFSGLNTPGANVIFALDFYSGSGSLISSASLDLEAAGLGGPDPGLNWEKFTLSAVSPAGTATVRARGSMLEGAFFQDPGQALVTDEWALNVVPEPSSIMLGGIALLGLVSRRRA